MRILIIEDEKKVSNFLRQALEEEQYAVDQAFDGVDGLDLACCFDYDLIVLDLMLPKKGGIQIIRDLRNSGYQCPILVLTARDKTQEKVLVLDSGCDDFLTKPVPIEEFLARVRALLRRVKTGCNNVLKVADLSMNLTNREVCRKQRRIELTNKEFALLEYFIRKVGMVLTRSMIAEHVWNIDFDTETNVIDVYVTYLRNKIDKGEDIKLIHTIRGVGYMLKDNTYDHQDPAGTLV